MIKRKRKLKIFDEFLKDILPHSVILTLPKEKYAEITDFASKYKMDFDDTYQSLIAIEFKIGIKTMDTDFTRILGVISVDIF